MESKLEPEYTDAYDAWKSNESPETRRALLSSIQPAINKGIQRFAGDPNPLIRSHAKRIVLSSIPRYEPSSGKLGTYVYNQLAGLQRIAGKQNATVRVPERIAIDRQALRRAETELADELGRDPSDAELADYSKFSLKRIARIRQYVPGVASGSIRDESGNMFDPGINRDSQALWESVVYDDLDDIDRVIFEHTLGYNGKKQLTNQEIARRLKLSPGAVSQRKSKIQKLLSENAAAKYF